MSQEQEIKHPFLDKPDYAEANKPAYDYRNFSDAGKFRGVGQAGKVGKKTCSSHDPMPPKKAQMKVPRDHKG